MFKKIKELDGCKHHMGALYGFLCYALKPKYIWEETDPGVTNGRINWDTISEEMGVSKQAIHRWIKAKRIPQQHFIKLAALCKNDEYKRDMLTFLFT